MQRLLFLLALPLLLASTPAAAQVHLGADLTSRYVWRGFDFGESFSIQPTLEYAAGPLSLGTWASYSVAADGSAANEHDLYVSLAYGPFEAGVTDYYFPTPPALLGGEDLRAAQFFNFDNAGEGAHYFEPYVAYTGPEAFPLELYGAMVAYNDPDHSAYLEAAFPFTIEGVALSLSAGVVPMASGFYGTSGPAFVKAGLSASKAIPLTETFSLPVGVGYIINPYTERTFLVFGVSL